MRTWIADIAEGYPADLAAVLTRLTAEGWTIFFITPNGINRWTVVGFKDE